MAFADTPQIADAFTTAAQALLARMGQYDTLADTLRGQVEGLKADKAALQAAVDAAKPLADEVQELRAQLAAAQQQVADLRADKDVIGTQRSRLQAEAARIAADAKRVQDELDKLDISGLDLDGDEVDAG